MPNSTRCQHQRAMLDEPARRTNRNAVAASSPALTDAVGLRWVNGQNENNSEGVVAAEQTTKNAKYTNGNLVFIFAWFAVELIQPFQG
jgi:hypothetical protein